MRSAHSDGCRAGTDSPPPARRHNASSKLSPSLRRILVAAVVACLSLFTFAVVGSAATPKPWMWTPAKAAVAVKSETVLMYEGILPLELASVKCRGMGKQVARRFLAFRCAAVYMTRGNVVNPSRPVRAVVSVKVRRVGKGSICAAIGTVPAACTAKGPRAKGTVSSATGAMMRKVGTLNQNFYCRAHGSGFYSCQWDVAGVTHRGTVVFRPSPVVRVLS